jgi:hypothetical protein
MRVALLQNGRFSHEQNVKIKHVLIDKYDRSNIFVYTLFNRRFIFKIVQKFVNNCQKKEIW